MTDTAIDPRIALMRSADAQHLSLTEAQAGALLSYLDLIQKWNKVYNLTAVRNPADMVTHHLLDSLAVIAPLGRQLALMRDGSFDTVAKKAAFIQQVAAALQLPNLRGLHARVENLSGPFDVISSRAFASLADFVGWSRAALGEGGCWLAMKGRHPGEEIAALPAGISVFHVEQLQVPGLHAERCVIWMREARATDAPVT